MIQRTTKTDVAIVRELLDELGKLTPDDEGEREVEVYDEITGHFCPSCYRLRSLSINTTEEG